MATATGVACLCTTNGWARADLEVTEEVFKEVNPIAKRVYRRYADPKDPAKTRYPTSLEKVRHGLIAERLTAGLVGGEWGRGHTRRPDILHPKWGPIEVRWSDDSKYTPELTFYTGPRSQDSGHDQYPFILVSGSLTMTVWGWAFGWDILDRGDDWVPPGWRPKTHLRIEELHHLPLHKYRRSD